MQTHCFKKTFNLRLIKLKKYLIAEGSSGSNGWARVKSERTYSREPLLRTIFFDSRGSANTQSMQARVLLYNIKRSRRLGLIPSAGIATADTRFKSFCTKTFPRKHVLVLVDSSTLGIPQTDSIWMSKRQQKKRTVTLIPWKKIDTRISLRCQVTLHFIARNRRSTMTVWSRTIIPTYGFWSHFYWFATIWSN